MFMLGFVLYGSTMALPLFLQTLLGYTAMQSGLALSPGGLAIMVMMPMVGFLLSKIEARWLVIFGLLVSAYGLFHMADFDLNIDFRHAVMARVVQSLGLAFLFVPINTMAFYFIAKQKHQLRHGPDQPGAQHRRQHGHRHCPPRWWRAASSSISSG